jgi:uncharacterized protein (DUF927 family)
MPMRLLARDGLELKERLLDEGLRINHAQQKMIPRYIAGAEPQKFLHCATHTGWNKPGPFVLPDEVIGNNGVWFQSTQRIALYRKKGSFEDWRAHVAVYAKANPYLLFTLSFALYGPLLKSLNISGAGVHFYGD